MTSHGKPPPPPPLAHPPPRFLPTAATNKHPPLLPPLLPLSLHQRPLPPLLLCLGIHCALLLLAEAPLCLLPPGHHPLCELLALLLFGLGQALSSLHQLFLALAILLSSELLLLLPLALPRLGPARNPGLEVLLLKPRFFARSQCLAPRCKGCSREVRLGQLDRVCLHLGHALDREPGPPRAITAVSGLAHLLPFPLQGFIHLCLPRSLLAFTALAIGLLLLWGGV